MNEPFFYDGGYKTNKVIKFFFFIQVNEFIRVKIVIMLNSHSEKVILITFISEMLINQYLNINN